MYRISAFNILWPTQYIPSIHRTWNAEWNVVNVVKICTECKVDRWTFQIETLKFTSCHCINKSG